MKKFRILYIIGLIAVTTVSCESYDDYETPRKTVAGFTSTTKNINGIPEGGTKSNTVNVFVSDVSDVERTFNIVSVPVNDSETNPPTASENFTFDSVVVIPANERDGEISITGIDVSITTDRTFFALAIENGTNVVSGSVVLVGLKN